MMILNTIQPEYDYNEVHSITVKSSVRTAFSSIKNITPSEIAPVMRMLICLRSFFERLACRKGIGLKSEDPLLSQMAAGGFMILAENTPYEILLGMLIPGKIGRIWDSSSNLNMRFDNVQEFLAFDQAGYIRVMMNLVVKETDKPGYVSIRTETRCCALSRRALADFTPYWRLIRPFSGLIRIVWLKGIKRKSEKQTKGTGNL